MAGGSDNSVEKKPFKCLMPDCKKNFATSHKTVLHSTIHKNRCWICPKKGCTNVVNETEIGHVCSFVATSVDDGQTSGAAVLIDGLTKAQMKKQISRY